MDPSARPDRDPVELHFAAAVGALPAPAVGPGPPDHSAPVRAGSCLSVGRCLELFDNQLASRHLDVAARWLQSRGEGYYTIGSSGHEGNAGVAAALRMSDPALLHYRSGAFYQARAAQADRPHDAVADVLLGLVAAASEPIAGGRHKVFGSAELNVIPQTSTIASHLPRALGVAFALGRAAKLGLSVRWPDDAVVVTSFGDATVNHSTAAGALNTAGYCAHAGLPLPLLLVCEDNGLGISVPSPPGWVATVLSARPGLGYTRVDGCDVAAVYDASLAAVSRVRRRRAPEILHLEMIRLGGHAGADVESAYRSRQAIEADLERDPLLVTARMLVAAGALSADAVLHRYESGRERVLARAAELAGQPQLADAAEVMAPIAPRRPSAVAASVADHALPAADRDLAGRLPEREGPLTLAQSINRTLADELAARPSMLLFGEDVGAKGGVYGVTRGLAARFGSARVFDSPLDEQSILGLALGAGVSGLLPVPEIQYLAYLHNAIDQVRGEAATLSFFSSGQYRNPMVVRIAGLAYQRGFGGHFHNDNSLAALREIPGVVVACPARPDDAPPMLRTCLAAAASDGTVCLFLEPIALYHERDLYESGDGGWLAGYEPPSQWAASHVPVGSARVHGDGRDVLIVTFGNGLHMSLRAARQLARDGIRCRVLDLRWLAPLPVDDLLREAFGTGRVLVADETRESGGVSESVFTALVGAGFAGPLARVTSKDSFIPLGTAAAHVLLSERVIEAAVNSLLR